MRLVSAGGLLYRRGSNGECQVFLVKHQDYGYVLPKGGKGVDEAWLETAVREVKKGNRI